MLCMHQLIETAVHHCVYPPIYGSWTLPKGTKLWLLHLLWIILWLISVCFSLLSSLPACGVSRALDCIFMADFFQGLLVEQLKPFQFSWGLEWKAMDGFRLTCIKKKKRILKTFSYFLNLFMSFCTIFWYAILLRYFGTTSSYNIFERYFGMIWL